MPDTLTCLTIRQPWASLVMLGHKDVENRKWEAPARVIGQRIGIHAATTSDPEGVARAEALGIGLDDRLPTGVILGTVVVRACEQHSDSPWADADSPWFWRLEDPELFAKPVPARGQLGLWKAAVPGVSSGDRSTTPAFRAQRQPRGAEEQRAL